jgi:hypothetical protein
VSERAWRCQERLHARWRRMAGRGKPSQKIVVACARELAGFVVGDRDRPAAGELSGRPLVLEQRMRPTTRRTLEPTMRHRPRPATRELRPRQLPTDSSHAVPTGECQSDPPSLSWAVRCSRPRGDPSIQAGPLDNLLRVSGLLRTAVGISRTARHGQRDAESRVSSEPEGSSTAPSVRLRDTAGRAA